MNIDDPDFQKKIWLQAIALRVDDMLKGHPEIDSDSRALLVDAVIAGLHAHPGILRKWQDGNSFIEHSFFDEEDQDNTKVSHRKPNTKIAKKVANNRWYKISEAKITTKRGGNYGKV